MRGNVTVGAAKARSHHLSDHASAEEALGWIKEVDHPVELVRCKGAAMRGALNMVHVPLQRSQMQRALVCQFGETQVFQQPSIPGSIDNRLDGVEPGPRKVGAKTPFRPGLPEHLAEHLGLNGTYGHPLAIDWVETADGISKSDEALGRAVKLLIVTAQAPSKAVVLDR